jgi:hypothetical protein
MTADPAIADLAPLERRRRISLRAAATALVVAIAGFPLGTRIGGSDDRDTIGGAILLAAIAGLIACPWIVRAWQGFMRRRMIAAAAAGRTDIRHIDGERDRPAREQALASAAFSLEAFRDSGLVEAFESVGVHHILTGDAQGVPFAIAEIDLLDAKGYRLFSGVLGSFRLAHPHPGLTIVTRDHGLIGNFLARAGSAIEALPLEDPSFEGVFEAYGTDQVAGRVVLTTTMLERLKALDERSQAHGFACAFLEDHLLIAFPGVSWRCPSSRILRPVDTWLQRYVARLTAVLDLPVEIVHTLNLAVPSQEWPPPTTGAPSAAFPIESGSGQVFTSAVWRLVGEGGTPLATLASGLLFGGVALFGAWYGIKEGYSNSLFWYFWGLISAGLAYGAVAITGGVRDIARLAWRWNAPLRSLKGGSVVVTGDRRAPRRTGGRRLQDRRIAPRLRRRRNPCQPSCA